MVQPSRSMAWAWLGSTSAARQGRLLKSKAIARAFQIPVTDQFVFNAMLAHSDRQRKKR